MNNIIMINEEITLRKLNNTESDYKLLAKWYHEEAIYSHFEQRILNYEEIVKKYYPRTLEDAKIPVYMIECNHQPVGIIQYQKVDEENKKLYKLTDDNSYEIDIFIGELNLHNKGIGRRSVTLLSNYLFKEKKAVLLVMCPLKDNINAIHCYEKVGFKINNEFTTGDTVGITQEYVLMCFKKSQVVK